MTGSELHEARFNRGSDARRFSLEGFVVRRVLDSTTLASLRHLFDQIRPRDVEGLTTTTVGRSLEENLAVARQIDAATADGISSVVTGYTPIGATFLAKGPGSGGELTLHQDWTSVDERRSHSMNVWCHARRCRARSRRTRGHIGKPPLVPHRSVAFGSFGPDPVHDRTGALPGPAPPPSGRGGLLRPPSVPRIAAQPHGFASRDCPGGHGSDLRASRDLRERRRTRPPVGAGQWP